MNTRLWRGLAMAAVVSLFAVVPVRAQEITADVIDRFIKAFTAEQAELGKVQAEVAEIDEKIKKFNECKQAYEVAGEVAGGGVGGLAAKAAMRAKCGATSDDGYRKDKAKIYAAPEKAALDAGKFKSGDYAKLKEKFGSWAAGDRNFKAPELEAMEARKDELSKLLGELAAAQAPRTGGGNKAAGALNLMAGGGAWTMDFAWGFIGQMFGLMFMSGATMLEEPFQPGEFAVYEVSQTGDDQKLIFERAFLGKTQDGGEWWRMKYVISQPGEKPDTVNLEALFKPQADVIKQVVRMKGKLPGSKEAQELMVPQHLTLLTSLFPMKPTQESIAGATIGTEQVAGTSAKHVKFGAPNGGALEWWMTPNVPGGVARFRISNTEDNKTEIWTMEVKQHGKGAKSELGVM